jgi:hypothetical protein
MATLISRLFATFCGFCGVCTEGESFRLGWDKNDSFFYDPIVGDKFQGEDDTNDTAHRTHNVIHTSLIERNKNDYAPPHEPDADVGKMQMSFCK